jgi:flagellar biosynthesis/type III secretory pathway protein FliH
MEDQKILHTEEINWYEEDQNRLDYEVAFDGNGYKKSPKDDSHEDPVNEQQVDVKQLINKRDKKWEKRLAKVRKEARQEGYEQGYEKGFNDAEQEIDGKLDHLEHLVENAHSQWIERQKMLNPGLLDLVFDIVEEIVGLPVENPEIREQLEDELSVLFHETDSQVKPQLWVSEEDYEFVKGLIEKYSPELSLSLRVSEDYNTGEFEFETDKETVVHCFREKLADFKENITLPSWT